MSAEHTGGNKWLTGLGLMISAPVIVMAGAVAMLILSTPVMLAITVIAFATALLWAATVVTRQTPGLDKAKTEAVAMCESAELVATLEPRTLEMIDSLTGAPKFPVNASVTKVAGPCPLGMMPGNTWRIGPDGKLSRPICRPGATALSALFRTANGGPLNRPVRCQCVFAGREVTFTVREPAESQV